MIFEQILWVSLVLFILFFNFEIHQHSKQKILNEQKKFSKEWNNLELDASENQEDTI
jgi:hypothetical protein